jgi:RNA polymerase sigma factor (sigma-70 family)
MGVSMTLDENQQQRPTQARFGTTHWSVVLAAGDQAHSHCAEALQSLCQTYWFPLYAFVRRQDIQPDEALDLTQGFFARLLEKEWLAAADPERGRFRNFLMASIKHFMGHEWARQRAKKRGGGCCHFSLDRDSAETRYRLEPLDDRTPEQMYERQWALTVLEQVMTGLRQDYETRGKGEQFDALKSCLALGSQQQSYAELAVRLNSSEGAVRVMVHRLKQQYRKILRRQIAQTVNSAEEVESEIRHLFQALAG